MSDRSCLQSLHHQLIWLIYILSHYPLSLRKPIDLNYVFLQFRSKDIRPYFIRRKLLSSLWLNLAKWWGSRMSNGAGWLQISTEGFAALNQSRPPEHLVKELVQNSLDAVQDIGGRVELSYRHDGESLIIRCRDTGTGIDDLSAMRVVYLTFKTDSHLKRGRFGRGFKEILSVADTAAILSGNKEIRFFKESGQQVTRETDSGSHCVGTDISMRFDWPPDTVQQFDAYFERLLVPANVQLALNGRALSSRDAAHIVEGALTTEVYNPDSHSWKKPRRKTSIELVEVHEDEEPYIYEMGIPVAPAEWSVPYHANVQQRVPMNPNRDALASGYAKRIHKVSLPTLLPELSSEETTADWVGTAGAESAPEIQKEIISKAFGAEAVRSVPAMGKRDFDHDAERIGSTIVKTSQMSSGFRAMAKEHLPSAKETVVEAEATAAQVVAEKGFHISDIAKRDYPRFKWIEKHGGKAHVEQCLSFAVWFCQKLVDSTGDMQHPVTGNLALGRTPQLFSGAQYGTFLAHWSGTNVLTLAIDAECFWREPFGAESLSILIHEAAHARNMHHGKGFVDEIERLAGVAAAVMFDERNLILSKWPELADGKADFCDAITDREKTGSWMTRLKSLQRSATR